MIMEMDAENNEDESYYLSNSPIRRGNNLNNNNNRNIQVQQTNIVQQSVFSFASTLCFLAIAVFCQINDEAVKRFVYYNVLFPVFSLNLLSMHAGAAPAIGSNFFKHLVYYLYQVKKYNKTIIIILVLLIILHVISK